jgi:hypothetical protein
MMFCRRFWKLYREVHRLRKQRLELICRNQNLAAELDYIIYHDEIVRENGQLRTENLAQWKQLKRIRKKNEELLRELKRKASRLEASNKIQNEMVDDIGRYKRELREYAQAFETLGQKMDAAAAREEQDPIVAKAAKNDGA